MTIQYYESLFIFLNFTSEVKRFYYFLTCL